MQSKMTRYAAAAVIIIGVVLGFYFFSGTGGVAWAEVVKNLKLINTYTFEHCVTITNTTEQKTTDIRSSMYGSTEHGWRAEMTIGGGGHVTKYISPSEGSIIELIHEMKMFNRARLSEGQIEEFRNRSEPYKMVEGLLSLEYRELGRSVIEGIEVEGVEITDAKMAAGAFDECTGRLWVSVETNLPVRIEFEGVSAGGTLRTFTVADRFDWGAVLDASVFKPEIPEDYELLVDVDVSDDDEDKLLLGLRDFSEVVDGRYPSVLSIMTASKEISFGLRLNRVISEVDMNTASSREEIQKAVTIQASCLFYAKLIKEDCDAAYYGDRVTAEFGDSVLLRWRLDDGSYRVVFGDLGIETVSAEELAEFESLPLNRGDQAIKPEPADGSVVSPTGKLRLDWMPGMGAVGHRLYFGTDANDLPLYARMSDSGIDELPQLQGDTTYYWRVDEVFDDESVAAGEVWSFRTGKLVGQWKLDEGEGPVVADASGNGLEGQVIGDAKWTADGVLEFDGAGDYVDLGTGPEFEITGQITVMSWIRVDLFDKEWQAIITKGEGAWRLSRDQGDNLHFACTGMYPEWVHGKANVNDGQWHHAAGVWDGKTMSLYVDGKIDVSTPTLGSLKTNDEPVYIGSNSEKPDREWNGVMADVRLYDYALSAEEIEAIFQEAHSEPGL
jgi:outer membrane lipoprotein-sorting protein